LNPKTDFIDFDLTNCNKEDSGKSPPIGGASPGLLASLIVHKTWPTLSHVSRRSDVPFMLHSSEPTHDANISSEVASLKPSVSLKGDSSNSCIFDEFLERP
jgi:hypothetical protein